MDDRQSFQQRLETQFNELAGRLNSGLHRIEAEARRQAGDLPQHLDSFERKMGEFKSAGDEKWREMKPGLERSWTELRDTIEKALSRKSSTKSGPD